MDEESRESESFDIAVDSLTIHGISQIYEGNKKEKVVWSVIFCFSLAIFTTNTHRFINKYLENRVGFEKVTSRRKTLQLPSFTFCNSQRNDYRFAKGDVNANDVDDITTAMSDEFYNFSKKYHFCTFGGKVCGLDDFYAIGKNSKCVTLNSTKKFSQQLATRYSGFEIALYKNGSKGGELSMVVHDPQETPSADFDQIILSSGMITFIEIKKTETHRLPHPYSSQCSNGSDTSTHLPGIYTYNGCFESCYMQKLNLFCGDIVPMQHYRYMPEKFKGNKTALNFTVEEQLKCYSDVTKSFLFNQNCTCPLSCHGITYQNSINMVNISMDQWKMLYDIYGKETTKEELVDSIYFLKLYYGTLQTEKVSEYPAYDFFQALGDIGGIIGLTLGASIISIIELIVLSGYKLFRCKV